MIFKDRAQAGLLLAKKLKSFKDKNALVLGIPRGGAVVAKAVAKSLRLPLDIIVIKKIGAPFSPELAIGALGPQDTIYWDENLCQRLGINNRIKNQELRIKEKERKEREKILHGWKRPISLRNKTVILVDDGVATGATVLTACKYLKTQKIKSLILAVPVISKETLDNIKQYFDNVVVLSIEEDFMAVGQFYHHFPQVNDDEVVELLSN